MEPRHRIALALPAAVSRTYLHPALSRPCSLVRHLVRRQSWYLPSCSRMGRTTPPDGYMQARTCVFTDMVYPSAVFIAPWQLHGGFLTSRYSLNRAFSHQKRLPLRCRSLDKSLLLGYHVRNYTVKPFEDASFGKFCKTCFASKDGQRCGLPSTSLTVFLFCSYLDYYICGISSTLSLRDG